MNVQGSPNPRPYSGRDAYFGRFKRKISDTEYEFETRGGFVPEGDENAYPYAVCANGYDGEAENYTDPYEMDIHTVYIF